MEDRLELIQRFLSNVRAHPMDGCWFWRGHIKANGYGTARAGGVLVHAHRLAWQLEYGAVPVSLCVCHHCDNRACVRPDHLFLGSHALNSLDMHQKGRRILPKGERNGKAKLTASDVLAIRAACEGGVMHAELAARYGVTCMTISNIHCRASWKHI
jgi:hypothetical protein